MSTYLAIDDALLEQACKAGRHKTEKATVNEALKDYIERRKQAEIAELLSKTEFDPNYDYKRQRKRK